MSTPNNTRNAPTDKSAKIDSAAIRKKLGDMFVEIASRGSLTPELAKIYLVDLCKMKGQGRAQAILQIVDAFKQYKDTYLSLMDFLRYRLYHNKHELMAAIFKRYQPIIAAEADPKKRIETLRDFSEDFRFSNSNRVTAFDEAFEALESIPSRQDKFKNALRLCKSAKKLDLMDVDRRPTLFGRATDKTFQCAAEQETLEESVIAYQAIYDDDCMDKAGKERAVAAVAGLVDQIQSPQARWAALKWVMWKAPKGMKLIRDTHMKVEVAITKLPTAEERVEAAQAIYNDLFLRNCTHDSTDIGDKYNAAVMRKSLVIVFEYFPKIHDPKEQMDAIYWLYNKMSPAMTVIAAAMSLVDRQSTLSERQALIAHLLKECLPDYDPYRGYIEPGTLKYAATEKLKSIEAEIEQRREKAPSMTSGDFARLVAGYLPPAPR